MRTVTRWAVAVLVSVSSGWTVAQRPEGPPRFDEGGRRERDGLRRFGEGGPPPFGVVPFPGGGPPPGGGFGPPGWGPPGYSGPFGPPGSSESRQQRFEMFLRGFDTNGDGVISPGEVTGPRRSFFEGVARRAGLDPTGPVSVANLRDAMMSRAGRGDRNGGPSPGVSGGSPGSPSAGPKSADPTKQPAPLVPGFGVSTPVPAVPGFGAASQGAASPGVPGPSAGGPPKPPGSPPPASPPPGAPGSSSSSSASSAPGRPAPASPDREAMERKVREFAEGLLKRYDANKNGKLEKEEWTQMRGDWREADRNGDSVITLDELTARMIEFGQRGWGGDRGRPERSAGGGSTSSSTASSGSSRKSYRFLSPLERLPKGLPDWFLRKDANEDGQITMAEYSTVWSDALAEEFGRYDLNADGVITPAECLKAQSRK